MKSFFVIKGNPHQWFDQQGKPIESYYNLPHIKTKMVLEHAIGAEIDIDNPNTVPNIKIFFHVRICEDITEVNFYAAKQNIEDEL